MVYSILVVPGEEDAMVLKRRTRHCFILFVGADRGGGAVYAVVLRIGVCRYFSVLVFLVDNGE